MGDKIFNLINYGLLILIAVVVLYPLYFVVVASITDPMVVNNGTLLLYPVKLYTKGYEKIFQYKQLWSGYLNSLIYMVLGTCVNLFITLPGAYALSRKAVSYTHLGKGRPGYSYGA